MPLIRRIRPTSDETPPWAGMCFVEPVDSDALHEHLKMLYPQCTTLRERKHMAAIDFLKAELHQMQSKGPNSVVIEHSADYPALGNPRSLSLSSEGFEGRSRQGSVALSHMSLSSTQPSTSVDHVLHDRHSSTTTARIPPKRPSTGDFGQQIVFNAVDGRTMKPKTKRKMTTEERNAYKETRKRGACPKCKRQKGKCTHAVDIAEDSERAEEAKKPSKRRLSRDPSMSHTESGKMAKLGHEADVRHLPSGISQQQQDPSFFESLTIETEVGDPSGQPNIESGDMQWGQKLRESDQSGIVGYVHHHVPMEQFAMTLPRDTASGWTHFPATTGVQPFNPVFYEIVEDPIQPERLYPLSPSQSDLRPEFSFPPDNSGQEPWTENQKAHLRNANPD